MTEAAATDLAGPRADPNLAYRPDIEGLRGVAILLVVLGHAGVPGFRGGFTGVDVFFVISGFLITDLLLRELQQTSNIRFWNFYARRVRRLLPAFAVMMVGVSAAMLVCFSGTDQLMQATSSLFASLWSSNIYYAVADFGYFEQSAADSAFLHTWSLGVEEQFYIFWPLLVACAWKFSNRCSQTAVATTIAIVAVGGFLLSLWATFHWPIGAYYLMPFRLWELAAGGACSALLGQRGIRALKPFHHGGLVGAVLLMFASVAVSEHAPYPGAWALLPTIGAALLIAWGALSPTNRVSRLLASAPLSFVGRISYSWYLWHWPALAFARGLGHGNPAGLAAAVVVSLALAILSYALIERTTRHRAIHNAKQVVFAGVFGSILLAVGAFRWREFEIDRLFSPRPPSVEQHIRSTIALPLIYGIRGCDDLAKDAHLVPCHLEPLDPARPTVVILGDSVVQHWFPALHRIFANQGWNVVALTKSACPMVDRPLFYEHIRRRYTECEAWRKAAAAYVQEVRPKLLVTGSAGTYPFTPEDWIDGSKSVLDELRKTAQRVVVLAPSPLLPFDGRQCVSANAKAVLEEHRPDICSVPLSAVENGSVIGALEQAVIGMRNVSVLNLNDIACPQGICSAWVGDRLAFRDAQHLNAPYVETLAASVAARFVPDLAKPQASTAAK